MRWTVRIARMVESEDACRVLVGNPEEQGPPGRPRIRWENNINP